MAQKETLPTLRDIHRGLAAGDAQNAYDSLSPLRGEKGDASAFLQQLVQNSPHARTLLNEAESTARQMAGHTIPTLPFSLYRLFEETGERTRYQKIYNNEYFIRPTANALSWMLTRDRQYLRQLEDCLWALCDSYSWCQPAHFEGNGMKPPAEGGREDDPRCMPCSVTAPNSSKIDLSASNQASNVAQMLYLFGEDLEPIIVRRLRDELRRYSRSV